MNNGSAAVLACVMLLSPSVSASGCNSGGDAVVQTPASASRLNVEYDQPHRRLSVSARQQHLDTLLACIADATGIEFVNDAGNGRELVDVEFGNLKLESALAQLFRNRSYVVRTNAKAALTVWLLPPGDGERLTGTDVEREAFYAGMQGNRQIEDLADTLRRLEENPP